jgi:hypothetical protein
LGQVVHVEISTLLVRCLNTITAVDALAGVAANADTSDDLVFILG